MCGIAAIIAEHAGQLTAEIKRMTECLRHRGPDAGACQPLAGCIFGHRRLSIIDLSTGAQPMSDASSRYWITFNGEIYNYRELRRALEARGATFHTASDTEVILQAYALYGHDTPQHLNGQFAFVIWDQIERTAFAARDRLGEKPLYWAATDHGEWLFASEIKSLIASGMMRPQVDRAAIEAYLALLYVPPDRTIYTNVQTLPPGHALTWRAGRIETWAYWTPVYSSRPDLDWPEAVAHTRQLIEQAVRRQMVADVPIGAFLSGGLDSSTVVALMAQQTDRVVTFSVGFGDLIDELPYARAVANKYHTEHHAIQMDIPVGEMLERMAEVYDEPLADSSNIPTYLIAQFARQFVTVALSGDGGDELFGGYDWYRWLNVQQPVSAQDWVARYARAAWWRGLQRLTGRGAAQAARATQTARAAWAARRYPDVWERHLALSTNVKADRTSLWGGQQVALVEDWLRNDYRPSATVREMDRVTDFDVRCYLPGDILVKVDRASLAHGLESRAPFLDAELVEFVWSLPWRLRFRDEQLKELMRAACRDLWPVEVQQRTKQGFGAPIWQWLQRPEVQRLVQRVSAPHSPLTALLPGARTMLRQTWPQQAWTLLCLGLWLEKHAGALP